MATFKNNGNLFSCLLIRLNSTVTTKVVKNSTPIDDDWAPFHADAIQGPGASWLNPIRLGSPIHHRHR